MDFSATGYSQNGCRDKPSNHISEAERPRAIVKPLDLQNKTLNTHINIFFEIPCHSSAAVLKANLLTILVSFSNTNSQHDKGKHHAKD